MALLLSAATPSVQAELCSVDNEPAATLLLPYFEVDLDDPTASNTTFSIENTEATPALVHLIFWTDWGLPTIDFDVFLTGHDMVVVDLADVFAGNIPITADAANDPNDTISPAGVPAWDGSFAFCDQIFPFFNNPVITGIALARLMNGHTGQTVPGLSGSGARCLGEDHGDNVARGYLTMDVVSECSLVQDPGSTGLGATPYFADGEGVATNQNRLRGEVTYQQAGNTAATPLIAVQAGDAFDETSTPTGYTFYGSYTGGSDNREPLGTSWSVPFSPGAELLVWRDSTVDDPARDGSGYACSTGPEWRPMGQNEVHCFNEGGASQLLCEGADCFPLTTQRSIWGAGELSLPFSSGWCYLNLNAGDGDLADDTDFPAPEGNIRQSVVIALQRPATPFDATIGDPLTSACQDADRILCGGSVPLPCTSSAAIAPVGVSQ